MLKVDYADPCIEQPCPYLGYTDTKKCWFHSRGKQLPENPEEPTFDSGPMTFKEACELSEEDR